MFCLCWHWYFTAESKGFSQRCQNSLQSAKSLLGYFSQNQRGNAPPLAKLKTIILFPVHKQISGQYGPKITMLGTRVCGGLCVFTHIYWVSPQSVMDTITLWPRQSFKMNTRGAQVMDCVVPPQSVVPAPRVANCITFNIINFNTFNRLSRNGDFTFTWMHCFLWREVHVVCQSTYSHEILG